MLDGVRCRHVDSARLRSQGASTWGDFGGQKVRYEAGRMAAARTYVPRLLKRGAAERDASCLEAAWFLATPPFALAALSLSAGAGLAAVAGAWISTAIFAAGLLALALTIVTGLIQGRAGRPDVAGAARRPVVRGVQDRCSATRIGKPFPSRTDLRSNRPSVNGERPNATPSVVLRRRSCGGSEHLRHRVCIEDCSFDERRQCPFSHLFVECILRLVRDDKDLSVSVCGSPSRSDGVSGVGKLRHVHRRGEARSCDGHGGSRCQR